MSFETCYTSSSCNQTPTVAHWGKNNLICYGSCNAVLINDIQYGSGGIVKNTLCSHSKRVNSVRWISGVDCETELVSGATDGTAIVWSYINDSYVPFVLKGHEGNINIVDGLYKDVEKKHVVVVTASLDSTVKIWLRYNISDGFFMAQTINFGYGICMGLKLSHLPNLNKLILACAMDNSNIQLYVEKQEDSKVEFEKSEILKGHESWVRSVDFTLDEKGDMLLASASQDAFVRLWRISPVKQENDPTKTRNFFDDEKYDHILKKGKIKTDYVECAVALESVLAGHEGWVYSVSWSSTGLKLLTVSLDKSMIIWEWDVGAGLWLEKARLGEVGGGTLGFYGGMFGPTSDSIMAHGYHGAFHIWNYSEKTLNWEPAVTVGGHFNEVVDLSWEPEGEFLMSVSTDQTTRIHAPWQKGTEKLTWHEIARPQVHGYDMSCLAVLSRYKFASGAEEKIIRTFDAPKNFVDNFRRICRIEEDREGNIVSDSMEVGPQGAAVPSLGLSNKAVYGIDNTEIATATSKKDPYPEESHFTAVDLTEPPTEETLLQNTLWPEVQKLYGHGYEVYALAATVGGDILASACKSTTLEHAAVLLWDTSTWTQIQKLTSHTLTVAQLDFSPDSKHLLSVSRDRRWSLFRRKNATKDFELVATTDKKTGIHTRIIWCCSWTPDSKYFATGSRDGKVVVWGEFPDKKPENVLGQYGAVCTPLELKGESITALAFAPIVASSSYLLSVGLESGIVVVYQWNLQKWSPLLTLQNSDAHHLTVKRLKFRPVLGAAGAKEVDKSILQLASCGSDHAVKIYNIYLRNTPFANCT